MGVRPSESRYMFEILLRHPDFVAINKPAGLCVHQDGAAESFTGLLAQQLGVARVWLLHRLDKPTGGVLLLALNPEAASVLAQQFAAHSMHKTYLALSSQKPAKKQGWVKGDMAKARRGAWKLLRTQHNPALTRFHSRSIAPRPALIRAATLKRQNPPAARGHEKPGQPDFGRHALWRPSGRAPVSACLAAAIRLCRHIVLHYCRAR